MRHHATPTSISKPLQNCASLPTECPCNIVKVLLSLLYCFRLEIHSLEFHAPFTSELGSFVFSVEKFVFAIPLSLLFQSKFLVEDADAGKTVQDDCNVPLYRDAYAWASLQGSDSNESIPFEHAREYTQQKCLEVWNRDVVEPVEAIVKGFREMIPAETFWKKLKGASQLKRLIEGSQEVDVDNFLARVVWQGGPWSGADRQVMEEVMRELGKQGSGLPILKQPLSKLLHYITGSSTEPVHAEDEFLGESLEKIVFVKADTDDGQCHLPQSLKDSHLWVAAPCLMEKALLMEQLHQQIISPSHPRKLEEQTHLLGFDDALIAAVIAGETRERVFIGMQPLSQGLRGLAQVEFKDTPDAIQLPPALDVHVRRGGAASLFQQMVSKFHGWSNWARHWTLLRILAMSQ